MSETIETSFRPAFYWCIGIKPDPPGDYDLGWTTKLKLKKKSEQALSKYVHQVHHSMTDMANRVTKLSSEKDALVKKLSDIGEQKHLVQKLSFENQILAKENNGSIDKLNEVEAVKNELEKELIKAKERMEHNKKWSRNRRRELYNKNMVLTDKLERAERELKILKESRSKADTLKSIAVNESAGLKKRIKIVEAQSKKYEMMASRMTDEKEELKKENAHVLERFLNTNEEFFQVKNENIDLVNKLKMMNKTNPSSEIIRLMDELACCKADNEKYKETQEKLIVDLQSMKLQLTGKLSPLATEKVSDIHVISESVTQKHEGAANDMTAVNEITAPKSVPEDAGDSGARG